MSRGTIIYVVTSFLHVNVDSEDDVVEHVDLSIENFNLIRDFGKSLTGLNKRGLEQKMHL